MPSPELSDVRLTTAIKEPEWETFEELSRYLEVGPTGLLGRLLPQSVWVRLFAPTQADPEEVRQQRQVVVEVYETVCTTHDDANTDVRTESDNHRLEDSGRESALSASSRTQYPLTASPRLDGTSLDEHQTEIQQALTAERTLIDLIDELLSDPHAAFLYADEQSELEQARSTFVQSLSHGSEALAQLSYQRQNLIETLRTQLSLWERELKHLREQATPYLEGTRYLANDVLTRGRELNNEIHEFRQTTSVTVLSSPASARVLELDSEVTQIVDRLETARTEFADQRTTQVMTTILQDVEDIESELSVSRQHGYPIELPQCLLAHIATVRETITKFEHSPYATHVSDRRVDAVLRYREDLDEMETFITDMDEVIAALDERLESFVKRHTALTERAEPYLQLTDYLSGESLLGEIRGLAADIESFRASHRLSIVSTPAVAQFEEIEESLDRLQTALKHSREVYSEAYAADVESSVRTNLAGIEEALAGAQNDGTSIELPTVLQVWIESVRETITDFEESPCTNHLPKSRVDPIVNYREQLDDLEAFIDTKTRYDAGIGVQTQAVHRLVDRARPYFEYDQYLTRQSRDRLIQQTERIEQNLEAFIAEIDVERLSDVDQSRLQAFHDVTTDIRSQLDGYNSRFVARQRDVCSELFSELGPSGFSLTTEQELAVIRNDIYNQVIAAAGTGKTLALTTRVAYLIEDRDIDPERILVLTYTREAKDEMVTRLRSYFDIEDVEVRTVHGFGRSLIESERGGFVHSIQKEQKRNLIAREIDRARTGEKSAFLQHYYEFLVHYDDVYLEEAEFETKEEYVLARLEQAYTTLRGEKVKSRAEKHIADFLFTHQIDYDYESLADWAETADDKKPYTPDFYLPGYDIYIEHWGVDEDGEVAPWFSQSSADYLEKMVWGREQFAASDYHLVETYHYEHQDGGLSEELTTRLDDLDVELDRMSFEELVDTAFEYDQREGEIKRKFRSFIDNARQFDLKPDAIEAALDEHNPRQFHFGKCGIYLLQQYVMFLAEHNLIDYADMIQKAVEILQDQRSTYHEQYDHVLVDEFQDIGTDKLQLIKELTGPQGARLFAVGDDWQSIYSFQGAIVEYFVEFESHFGSPVRTDLTQNFRSPVDIVDMGTHVIAQNDTQLNKEVRAEVDRRTTPRVHPLQGHTSRDYEYRVRDYAIALVMKYYNQGADPDEIMVLCRFEDATSYLRNIKDGLRSLGIPYVGNNDQYHGPEGDCDNGVAVYSVYQSKGREASHVILVHAAEGPYGFPPEERTDDLLSPVKPIEMNTLEEERRVFYVALTRSKHTLDLLTQKDQESQFIEEVSEFTEIVDSGCVDPLGDVGQLMTVTVKVNKLFDPGLKQHQCGYLHDRYGGSARFVSWESNHPPSLEEGEWYTMHNVQVREYNGEKELDLTYHSTIRHLEEGNPNRTVKESGGDSV